MFRDCAICVIWLNAICYVKQLHHFKVQFGEHFRNSYFTDKNVRVDNNESNAKMPIMLRLISALSNFTLIFQLINASSYFYVFFVRQTRRGSKKVRWCSISEWFFITKIVLLELLKFSWQNKIRIRHVSTNKWDPTCDVTKATNFH